ncbi:unnamed protein product [Discula destructiva]
MHFKSLASIALVVAHSFFAAADEVHLVNCDGSLDHGEVVYCANGVDCDATVPSNANLCQTSSGSDFVWEGSYHTCTFSTGVTFSWQLAAGVATYGYAGSASNGYETFSCYRDSDPVMAFTLSGTNDVCKSIYYCLSN